MWVKQVLLWQSQYNNRKLNSYYYFVLNKLIRYLWYIYQNMSKIAPSFEVIMLLVADKLLYSLLLKDSINSCLFHILHKK